MKYYFIKYTDNMPEQFAGAAYGPLIKIRPKFKAASALLEHEKFHVRQWYAASAIGVAILATLSLLSSFALSLIPLAFVLHQLLYKYVTAYRQWSEVEAYKAQIKAGASTNIDFAVNMLVSGYDLGIDAATARKLLTD